MERADGKAAGDDGFIPARGSGWQMERAPTPYQTRRAVREVTGPLHRMRQLTLTQITESTIKRCQANLVVKHPAYVAGIPGMTPILGSWSRRK
jgi:hypothetical protein